MKGSQIDRFARAIGGRRHRHSAMASAPVSSGGNAPRFARIQFGGTECRYEVTATGTAGPNAATPIAGVLSFGIREDGAISTGTLEFPDGSQASVVGQTRGRALRALVEGENGELIALIGTADQDISNCPPALQGPFGGPDLDDIGTWTGEGLGPA